MAHSGEDVSTTMIMRIVSGMENGWGIRAPKTKHLVLNGNAGSDLELLHDFVLLRCLLDVDRDLLPARKVVRHHLDDLRGG